MKIKYSCFCIRFLFLMVSCIQNLLLYLSVSYHVPDNIIGTVNSVMNITDRSPVLLECPFQSRIQVISLKNATKIVMQYKRVEIYSGYYGFLMTGSEMTSFMYGTQRKTRVLRMRRGEKKTENSEIIFWFIQEIAGKPVQPEQNEEMKRVDRNGKGAKNGKQSGKVLVDLIGIFCWSSKDNEKLLLDLGRRVACSDYSCCCGLEECRQNEMETGKSVNCS